MITVKTPSRICLFGEHQDYLGLEVIASAINLCFTARVSPVKGDSILLHIRDQSLSELGAQNNQKLYETFSISLTNPIVYENQRDYFKSAITVLRRASIEPVPCEITMDSEIPIGKGMCSSTTMVLAYLTALAAAAKSPLAYDIETMARLAWEAEVLEFNEPGGMMDHYASALGGLSHMVFSEGVTAKKLKAQLSGSFILIDSLQQKDTIKVLSDSKYPTLEALKQLERFGIHSIRDFYQDQSAQKYLENLSESSAQKVRANIRNYEILKTALSLFEKGKMEDNILGQLLNEHQAALRDGLGISTPKIDMLLELAIKEGAYGGKFNGSGGGGCLFVYTDPNNTDRIIKAVNQAGYPALELHQDSGLRILEE